MTEKDIWSKIQKLNKAIIKRKKDIPPRINRLELEKRYEALSKKEQKAKMFDGKRFVTQVLENSGKVVATQLSTYVMGNMVNKVAQKNIINVKKD